MDNMKKLYMALLVPLLFLGGCNASSIKPTVPPVEKIPFEEFQKASPEERQQIKADFLKDHRDRDEYTDMFDEAGEWVTDADADGNFFQVKRVPDEGLIYFRSGASSGWMGMQSLEVMAFEYDPVTDKPKITDTVDGPRYVPVLANVATQEGNGRFLLNSATQILSAMSVGLIQGALNDDCCGINLSNDSVNTSGSRVETACPNCGAP